jgi:hypothetical protein
LLPNDGGIDKAKPSWLFKNYSVNFSLPVYFLFFSLCASRKIWIGNIKKEKKTGKHKREKSNIERRAKSLRILVWRKRNKLERITAIMKRRRIKIKDPGGKWKSARLRLEGTVLTAAQARRSNRQPARDIIKVNKRKKKKGWRQNGWRRSK